MEATQKQQEQEQTIDGEAVEELLVVVNDPQDGTVVEFRGELTDEQAIDLLAEIMDHQLANRPMPELVEFQQKFTTRLARTIGGAS